MRWFYQAKEKSRRFYIYAYSREADSLDGLIKYDLETHSTSVMKPAAMDKNSKKAQKKALEHFSSVIERGFPDEYYACCG